MKGLTARQKSILEYICSVMEKEGHAPSLRETAEAFHMTPTGAHYAYRALREKGFLEVKDGSPRGVALPLEERKERENYSVLLYSTEPSPKDLQEGTATGSLFLPKTYHGEDIFAFTVTSSSMVNVGILPGDIAIMVKTRKAKDGDIILASIGQEETFPMELRRLRQSQSSTELWSENDNMGIIRSQNVLVYGILKEIRRSY